MWEEVNGEKKSCGNKLIMGNKKKDKNYGVKNLMRK